MTLPGWNNLEVVKTVHAFLELSAIIFFALLVIFEVVEHCASNRKTLWKVMAIISFAIAVGCEIFAYPYGRRIETLDEKKIAAQQNTIDGLSNQLGQLKASMQWRKISPEQETNLVAALKPFANTDSFAVIVNVEGLEPECKRFASQVANLLKDCGFRVRMSGVENIGTKRGEGIEIDVKSFQAAPPHAKRIFDAFRDQGLGPMSSFEDSRLLGDEVDVWILPKPVSEAMKLK